MSAPVTIAVVSWNTRDLLRRCLTSLAPSAESGEAEVWVVDNASSDGSAEVVGREFPWARLIESPDNLGFGRAVNRVAAEASSEWIAAANADVELYPGALATLMEAGRAAPAAAIVAPRLITPGGATQHSFHPFPTVGLALVVNTGLHRLPPLGERLAIEGECSYDRAREVGWAHGAFLLIRRSAFEEVGGFDAGQWMYAEDIDLQWRLRRAGWKVTYEPAAQARHEVSAAASKGFGDRRRQVYLDATYAWLARRRGTPVAWSFAGINAAGAAIRAAAFKTIERVSREDRYAERGAREARDARLYARGLRPRAALERAAGGAAGGVDG